VIAAGVALGHRARTAEIGPRVPARQAERWRPPGCV